LRSIVVEKHAYRERLQHDESHEEISAQSYGAALQESAVAETFANFPAKLRERLLSLRR